MIKPTSAPRPEANPTVRLTVDTKANPQSIRIRFTDQRLAAHGGRVGWSHFLHPNKFRRPWREVLPHQPTRPNAWEPTDGALGYRGGMLCGADKLSRVAWWQRDRALAQVLGVAAVASQSTLSRFFEVFTPSRGQRLGGLHGWAIRSLPSLREGDTLDWDAWALRHKDGHQQGVCGGCPRQGLKPWHRPLLAGLAEAKRLAHDWLRQGPTACVNGAAEFWRQRVAQRPAPVRVGWVRGGSGFGAAAVQAMGEALKWKLILVARWDQKIQSRCRHGQEHGQATEVAGSLVQEVEREPIGRRLVLIRHRRQDRPQAGGKTLLEVEGDRFQALRTNRPRSLEALAIWRRYNGRADGENRIKELGEPLGIKRLCAGNFGGPAALHHLAIAACNWCVLLQRHLGQLEKCARNTLRWRRFHRAAGWSRTQGKPTLKLALQGSGQRNWWRAIRDKLLAPPNGHAVGSLQA